MLIAAAVCPHPPLLVPETTGASDPGGAELERLRTACDQAVAALLDESPDLLVVVGGAPAAPADPKDPKDPKKPKDPKATKDPTDPAAPEDPKNPKAWHVTEFPPDAAGSLHAFGVPFTVGGTQPHRDQPPVLPLSLTIGKWLLARAAVGAPARPRGPQVAWWGIASDAATAECLELGEKLAAIGPRVAVLTMGDGPGRRARGVPGAADPQADRYDEQVAAALAAADPAALAALDPSHDRRLLIAGRAAWQVLAGAAAQDAFDADLRYRAAPFEVTYFVASWRRRARAG
jgi:hypothetical protein